MTDDPRDQWLWDGKETLAQRQARLRCEQELHARLKAKYTAIVARSRLESSSLPKDPVDLPRIPAVATPMSAVRTALYRWRRRRRARSV